MFDYFYGNRAEGYSFYAIPKILFTNKTFREIPGEAKILYGLMLEKLSSSYKNGWIDDENRAYIHFSIQDVEESMGCSRPTAVNMVSSLEKVGLIEKKRLGLGRQNIIYVKNIQDHGWAAHEKADAGSFAVQA